MKAFILGLALLMPSICSAQVFVYQWGTPVYAAPIVTAPTVVLGAPTAVYKVRPLRILPRTEVIPRHTVITGDAAVEVPRTRVWYW